jgi:hypothetical protein
MRFVNSCGSVRYDHAVSVRLSCKVASFRCFAQASADVWRPWSVFCIKRFMTCFNLFPQELAPPKLGGLNFRIVQSR